MHVDICLGIHRDPVWHPSPVAEKKLNVFTRGVAQGALRHTLLPEQPMIQQSSISESQQLKQLR